MATHMAEDMSTCNKIILPYMWLLCGIYISWIVKIWGPHFCTIILKKIGEFNFVNSNKLSCKTYTPQNFPVYETDTSNQ